MVVLEDNSYTLEDIINQIKKDFGFIYTKTSDYGGYILLTEDVTLRLSFNDNLTELTSALVELPSNNIDLTDSTLESDLILSVLESANQIVNLIKTKLRDGEVVD